MMTCELFICGYNIISMIIRIRQNNFQQKKINIFMMSQSDEFDEHQEEVVKGEEKDNLLSVKKFLSEPKQLMDKLLFASYCSQSFFPQKLQPLPDIIKPNSAHIDANNMNLIEESAFAHQRLKKDVLGFLLNHLPQKNTSKKHMPTLKQYYQDKKLVYERYPPNQKSQHLATYILDTKAVLKQDLQSKALRNDSRSFSAPSTMRNRIEFNSNFECGNLFQVYQREYNEYDLILQNDINTKGNNQWFYFSVRGVPKGLTLKFRIMNMSKRYSLFDFGMKPCVFSMMRHEKRKVGWVRQGMKVSYEENGEIKREGSDKPLFQLCFEYKFVYEGDIVYFSQSIPYSLTDLNAFLTPIFSNKNNYKYIKIKNLAKTLCNHQIDVIELTNTEVRSAKKVVWIVARQHSGEVTSSFMMEGVITFLLGGSTIAEELLQRFIFKIVPMVNVDGVVHGNTRAEIVGVDPNRKWSHPHKVRNPVIYALKKAIQKDQSCIEMFLDLHSHSRKLGTFFYGNSTRDSRVSTRKLPLMVCRKDPRFTYQNCRFTPCNMNSARFVLFNSLKIPLVYTVESSFYGYQKDGHQIIQYMPKDYREMGVSILQSFYEYSGIKSRQPLKRDLNFVEDEIEEEEEIDIEKEEESVGSNSDPSGDEFDESQLKKMLPKLYDIKKKKTKKLVAKNKKKAQEKKVEKQEMPPPKQKKNTKQSHYRIYFSGRQSLTERPLLKSAQISSERKQMGIQAFLPESTILKGSNTANSLLEKKGLFIWGQKMQDDLTVMGSNVNIQVDMNRTFTQNRLQQQSLRKSCRVTFKNKGVLQVKENNFLNRGDCGHNFGTSMPLRR